VFFLRKLSAAPCSDWTDHTKLFEERSAERVDQDNDEKFDAEIHGHDSGIPRIVDRRRVKGKKRFQNDVFFFAVDPEKTRQLGLREKGDEVNHCEEKKKKT